MGVWVGGRADRWVGGWGGGEVQSAVVVKGIIAQPVISTASVNLRHVSCQMRPVGWMFVHVNKLVNLKKKTQDSDVLTAS